MQRVEVVDVVDAPREAVEAALSPTSIIEYAGTYDVASTEEARDRVVVTGLARDFEIVLEFEEAAHGYRYEQRDGRGPFASMWAEIEVRGDDETRVTATSEFTFGGPLSFVTDRLGVKYRRRELERLLAGLEREVEGDGLAAPRRV